MQKQNGKVSFRLIVIAVIIGIFVSLFWAEFAAGAVRCCSDPCGAHIKVFSYFDENNNGEYTPGQGDGPMDGASVNLYNGSWGLMQVSISGRGDGSWEVGEPDSGWTRFPLLKEGTYFVCHGISPGQTETQPVPPYDHPSPWVSTVERPPR